MSSIVKSFEHYLELPAEVRMIINGEMNARDMCRFTRCSNLCNKEVKQSDKYIYGLTFIDYSDQYLKIMVQHGQKFYSRYHLVFQTKSGKKFITYYIESFGSPIKLWSIDLDISTSLVQLATEQFKKILNFYQNTIKQLEITARKNYDFQIKNLQSLRILKLNTYMDDIMEVISRRKRSLETFEYSGEMDGKLLKTDEYTNRVQGELRSRGLKLDIDQFRRLSAKNIWIHIGELTPNDVFQFVKAWKNGQLRKNFTSCGWELAGSDFEVQQLWGLLREAPEPGRRDMVRIEHNLEVRKFGFLTHVKEREERLVFSTN